jgi:hypothetical protein
LNNNPSWLCIDLLVLTSHIFWKSNLGFLLYQILFRMYFKGEGSLPIQTKDVISWIFDDVPYDQDMPVSSPRAACWTIANAVQVYIDAANPSNSISSRQARSIVRKLAAGFRAGGVKKGDAVCVHSFNDVRIYLSSPTRY